MMREYKKYDEIEMKDSGVEWIGEIPADWKTVKLKFITKCLDNLRIPLNSTERAEMKGNIPYWGANSIVDYVNDWLVDGEVILLGEDGAPFFDKLKNVAFYSNKKIWPNNHVHVLRVNNQNEIKYLIYSLNIADYTEFITGSTRDKLNQSAMSEIPIQLPSQNEQQKIVSFLDQKTAKIDFLIEKTKKSIQKYKKYKKSLIFEAVTGKIDLRDYKLEGGKEIAEYNNSRETEREEFSEVN
jgi:type I restriction enzyme S subunit